MKPIPQPLWTWECTGDRQVLVPALPWDLVVGPVRVPDRVTYFTIDDAALILQRPLPVLARLYRDTWCVNPTVREALAGRLDRLIRDSAR